MAQVFVYPASVQIRDEAAAAGVTRERRLHVCATPGSMSIAGRSIASLIHSQGIGDTYRIDAIAERDGVDFNLTFIPSSVNFPRKAKTPPGFTGPAPQDVAKHPASSASGGTRP